MKKFLIFLVSFIVIYFALQIGSGLVLTALYSPDIKGAWETNFPLSNEVAFGGGGGFAYLGIIIVLIAGGAAYFISKVVKKR
jgi:quinol-cytochrome oxidoreductase complex cytochrome b subunit